MTYSRGHPIRLVGGRLALDFVNTADWSAEGDIVHEKLACAADLKCWTDALGLDGVRPTADFADLLYFRSNLRQVLMGEGDPSVLNAARQIDIAKGVQSPPIVRNQTLASILATSALSILLDARERTRVKLCPGDKCGWLFLDETKNGRRRWCRMDGCGNRAKAARHYARRKMVPTQTG